MTRITGLWRIGMEAFFDASRPVDHTPGCSSRSGDGLFTDPMPSDAVAIVDRRFGTIYRAIVTGTDVEVAYRLMVTGSTRLLELRRLR